MHSIQEAVCIGFQSLCPSSEKCQQLWVEIFRDEEDCYLSQVIELLNLDDIFELHYEKIMIYCESLKSDVFQCTAKPGKLNRFARTMAM